MTMLCARWEIDVDRARVQPNLHKKITKELEAADDSGRRLPPLAADPFDAPGEAVLVLFSDGSH